MSSYVSEVAISGNGVRHNVSESSSVLGNSITISGKGVILDGEGSISQLDIQHLLSSRHLVLDGSEVTAELDASLIVSGRQLNINTICGTTIIDVSQQMGGAGSHTGIVTYWSSDYDSTDKKITLNSPVGPSGQVTVPHQVSLVGHNHDSRYYIEGNVFHIGDNTYEIYKRLSRLTDDVLISSPADGHILKWNSQLNKWVNAPNEGGTGASLFQIDGSDVKPKENRNVKTPSYITIGLFKIEEETVTISGVQTKRLRISRTDNVSADLYTTGGLSIYGAGQGGGGGTGALYDCVDVVSSGSAVGRDSETPAETNDILTYNGTHWHAVSQSSIIPSLTDYYTKSQVNNLLDGKASLSHSHVINDITNLQSTLNSKVTANNAITAATKCKITYDTKGLVTSGADLAESDIPSLSMSKITDLQDFKSLFDSMFEKVTSGNDWYIRAKKDFASMGGLTAYALNPDLTTHLYDLGDVPTYVGQTNKYLKVNGSGSLEWAEGGGGGSNVQWGTEGADYVPLSVNSVSKNILTHHQSLANYYTKGEVDTALGNKQNAISDLATIRSNAANGNTAYGWGNHASQGYLTASVAASTYHPKNGSVGLGFAAEKITLANNPNNNWNFAANENAIRKLYCEIQATGAPSNYCAGISIISQNCGFQIVNNYSNQNNLKFRVNNGTWGDWKEIYHSGNLTNLSQLTDNLGSNPVHTHGQYLPSSVAVTTYHPKYGSSSLPLTASRMVLGNYDTEYSGGLYIDDGNAVSQCVLAVDSDNTLILGGDNIDNGYSTMICGNGIYFKDGTSLIGMAFDNGKLGIGTTTPSEKLEIKGGKLKLTSADGTKSVTLELDNSGNLKINGNVVATGGLTLYQS